jgi:ATP:ADP antiporter, AAA family
MISILQTICKPLFGTFEREEFKKFLRMGVTFTCIIGAYWTLRVLKNALFCSLIGGEYLPWAKTASIICLVPLVMLYTKLLDIFSREKMFYILSTVYALITVLFALLLISPIGLTSTTSCPRTGMLFYATQILGFLWYVFVESYGSLVIALFWAIASDTTLPESAKKGFSMVVAIGQIGGIIGPYFLTRLPRYLGFTTSAFSVFSCSLFIIASIFFLKNFFTKTPKNLLQSFHGKNESQEEKEQEPGFFEGLVLLVKHGYLLGIFAVLCFFEIIVTVFDFHFQTLAATHYTGTALAEFQGIYGTLVNVLTLVCLLCGIGNITRLFGVGISLILVPLVFGFAVFGFTIFNSLTFLLALMVGSKAVNYALNGPAIKQLYIPTTHDVRFKSQAWIETFGSRASKEGGSLFNMLLIPLQSSLGVVAGRARHVVLSSYLGFMLVALWFFVALYLGRTYKKAIDTDKVVC